MFFFMNEGVLEDRGGKVSGLSGVGGSNHTTHQCASGVYIHVKGTKLRANFGRQTNQSNN